MLIAGTHSARLTSVNDRYSEQDKQVLIAGTHSVSLTSDNDRYSLGKIYTCQWQILTEKILV